jgi:TetR/AcrR family fatty acid metabolism transcriptional regulator
MVQERQSRGAESKARLFEAASRLFAERGYVGTKVSDIVAEAGVSQPTFYAYFESKETLFVELVTTFRNGLRDLVVLAGISEPVSIEEGEQYLRRTHIAILEYLGSNPVMTRIALLQAPDAAEVYRELAAILTVNLQREQQLGIIRSDLEAELIAEALVGIVHQLTVRYLLTGERNAHDLADFCIDLVFHGTQALPHQHNIP